MPARLIALLLVLVVPAAVPAGAGAASVAEPGAATAVREYRGTLVFSRYDAAAKHYRLAIRRPGAAPEDVPVAPADRTFDADIGPGSDGRPQLIYRRCDQTCDLFVFSLTAGTGERPVRNANDPGHDDVAPTLWKGRIAWARIYGEQRDRKAIVYTKMLTAPRSRRSTRLPGVPERRCGDSETTICGPTQGRSVDELELWGDNLGQTVTYGCRGCSGISQHELRLVRVSSRRASQIAFQVTGLSGQRLVGPSFFHGRLGWYKACLGDPAACQGGHGGPFRFGLRSRSYAKASGGPIGVHGFADATTRHFLAVGCTPETSGDFNRGCRIEEADVPTYRATRRPRR